MKALEFEVEAWRWIAGRVSEWVLGRAAVGRLCPLKLVERRIPEAPGGEWVRVRTLLGGICGTDLALVLGRQHPGTILQHFAEFPAVLGHENVGVIDAVGSGVGDWGVGQRVCVEPALGCAARGRLVACGECAAGRTSLCEDRGEAGLPARAMVGLNPRTGGSWAEYFVAHRSQLHAVPEGVEDEAAVMVDPLASAAHAVLRRVPRGVERVLVHGSGIVAMGVVAAIRGLGFTNEVSVIVRHSFQEEAARKMGASHVLRMGRGMTKAARYEMVAKHVGGKRLAGRFGNQALLGGFELCYDCTGSGEGLSDSMKWTRSRGTVVLVGTSGITLMDTTAIWLNEVEVIGANGRQVEEVDGRKLQTYELVMEWMERGMLDWRAIPMGRFRLEEYSRALEQLTRRGRHPILKAAFDFRGRGT